MKILVHIRPYSDKYFLSIARGVFGDNAEINSISEFRGCADYWEGDFSLDSKYDGTLDSALCNDIICRDRYLRTLPKVEACRIARRFWTGVEELFEQNNYDYVLLHPIDCHVQDICERIARLHGAKPISFVGSFLGGYAKFTLRGEGNVARNNIEEAEITEVASLLKDKFFLPDSETAHVTQTKKTALRYYFRRKLIESVINPTLRCLKRDWDNQQYGTKLVGDSKFQDLMPTNYDDYFMLPEDADIKHNDIYLPLHYTPEQTTDYFCKNISKVGYERYILSLIDSVNEDVTFIVKEHPAMFAKRPISFYVELCKRKNVKLIHPLSSSNRLLECIDNILVDNGTVGVEALIRGKRVIAFEKSYYSNLHPNIHLIDKIDASVLTQPIVKYSDESFVEDLLKQLFRSDLIADKNMNSCDPNSVVIALRRYLKLYGD